MTRERWLAPLRERVAGDPLLQERLLALDDPAAFAAEVATLVGVTAEEVLAALREDRRERLSRWVS